MVDRPELGNWDIVPMLAMKSSERSISAICSLELNTRLKKRGKNNCSDTLQSPQGSTKGKGRNSMGFTSASLW